MKTRVKELIEIAHKELRKNTDMGLEAAYHAIDELKKLYQKPTRHPSEITLDEFVHVVKILNPFVVNCVPEWYLYENNENNNIRIDGSDGKIKVYLHWDAFGAISSIIGETESQRAQPSFSQVFKIAAYLDSIGIEYRPKNKE